MKPRSCSDHELEFRPLSPLRDQAVTPVGEPETYCNWLLAVASVEIWENTYQSHSRQRESRCRVVRGTTLSPLLVALDPKDADALFSECMYRLGRT